MKKQLLVISLLCVAVATACKPVDDKMSSNSGSVPATTAMQPKSMSADGTQAGRVYAYEQKSEFVSSMKSQLAELSRSVDELSARVDKSTDSVKTEATPKVTALRAQVATMTQQLAKVDDATASNWVAVRSGAESAHVALRDSLMQSRDWMTTKAVL
jgi:cytochrome c556